MINRWNYDIEVFPNLFCATFKNVETSEVKVFTIFEEINQLEDLRFFLDNELLLIGFNNLMYDGAVINYLLSHTYYKELVEDIFTFSSSLINSDRFSYNPEFRQYQFPKDVKFKQMDLMKIMAFDKLGVGLKQVAINLKWHRIQDLPLPYDHMVKREELKLIHDYNLNDVLITEKFYHSILPQIELRERLSVLFETDLMNASDSRMANNILENFYTKQSGLDIRQVKDLRTQREQLFLKECIAPNIEFKTNYLKRIKREIEDTLVRKDTGFKYSKTINFGGVEYELGVGGLHSVDFPAKFIGTEEYRIFDKDVASYYPSMMIVNKIIPEHLSEDFIKVLDKITKERLSAKKTDKVKADGLKITINSIFGKLNSNTFWLEDAKAMLSVTVSGQLYLMMLIEELVLNGIEVISANTDGVVSRVHISKMDTFKQVGENWQNKTGFILEDTEYDVYSRQDVNNYLTKKHDGEIKSKGRYVYKADLKKGYRHPVVPRAMYEYLANGIPVEETIGNHKDILDFCVSQKSGSDFQMEYHKDDGSIEMLQKNNRFFISLNGGRIIKRRKSTLGEMEDVIWISEAVRDENGKIIQREKGVIGLFVGKKVRILNDFDSSIDFSTYDIDYDFYIEEANKYVSNIEEYSGNLIPFVDEEEGFIPEDNNKEKEELSYSLRGIKGLADKVLDNLLYLKINYDGNSFVDFLILAENNSMIASKFSDLIKIGYFKQFGSGKKLLKFFEEFRKGKSKYTNKLTEKSKIKRIEELNIVWDNLLEEEFSIMEQISNEMAVFGRVETKFTDINKRVGLVLELDTKNSPKLKMQSLRMGNVETFKVSRKIFSKKEFTVGQLLHLPDGVIDKKQSVRFAGTDEDTGKPKYEPVDGKFDYWLLDYNIVNNI